MTGALIAAMIGLAAALLAAALNARNNRRLETRKQLATLATAACVDMLQAFSENAMAMGELNKLNAGTSQDERTYWYRKLVESKIKFIHSKARLATYGAKEVTELLAFVERDGGFKANNPKHQQVLIDVIQQLRKDLDPSKDSASAEDVHELLF